jgi:BioD-like phosphotransacetylase family protein
MKSIFITSTSPSAGKTTLGLCLALNYPGKVGYFKPASENNDIQLFKDVLNLEEPENQLSLKSGTLKQRFKELSQDKDVLIIESGATLSNGAYKKLSASEIAKELDVTPVVITGDSPEAMVDNLIMGQACFSSIKGVVINKVPYSNLSETVSSVVPSLEEVGLSVLGTIPSYKKLRTFTPREVQEHVNAQVVCEGGMDKCIDNILVGAMSFDSALAYFRQYEDKVVITGGDRAEIMLAAMQTSTSCIVATGGVRPSPPVIKKAVDLGIPILMVEGHTYEAAKRVEEVKPEITPEDHEKLELIQKMICRHIDLKSIFE